MASFSLWSSVLYWKKNHVIGYELFSKMNHSTTRISGYCAQGQDESDSMKHFHSNPCNILTYYIHMNAQYIKETIHFWGEYLCSYAFLQMCYLIERC